MFNQSRGFGFIKPDGGGSDIFFHKSELRGISSVQPGDRVQFTVGEGRRGPAAKDVQLSD
ncbi:MAG: cold shock domain-containing protein [Anaerolineae bacterium]|nr:cold shock domain-containing protein [Anaerolineae bacterium]